MPLDVLADLPGPVGRDAVERRAVLDAVGREALVGCG
jgi:hypothetical protein